MSALIITEKTSQARDLRAALGDRFGQILPAEGHLLRLAEPHEFRHHGKAGTVYYSSRMGFIQPNRRRMATRPQNSRQLQLHSTVARPSFSQQTVIAKGS